MMNATNSLTSFGSETFQTLCRPENDQAERSQESDTFAATNDLPLEHGKHNMHSSTTCLPSIDMAVGSGGYHQHNAEQHDANKPQFPYFHADPTAAPFGLDAAPASLNCATGSFVTLLTSIVGSSNRHSPTEQQQHASVTDTAPQLQVQQQHAQFGNSSSSQPIMEQPTNQALPPFLQPYTNRFVSCSSQQQSHFVTSPQYIEPASSRANPYAGGLPWQPQFDSAHWYAAAAAHHHQRQQQQQMILPLVNSDNASFYNSSQQPAFHHNVAAGFPGFESLHQHQATLFLKPYNEESTECPIETPWLAQQPLVEQQSFSQESLEATFNVGRYSNKGPKRRRPNNHLSAVSSTALTLSSSLSASSSATTPPSSCGGPSRPEPTENINCTLPSPSYRFPVTTPTVTAAIKAELPLFSQAGAFSSSAAVDPTLLARAVEEYLLYNNGTSARHRAQPPLGAAECGVTIRYASVAQKSYGTEKRFICPPPLIKLTGSGWRAILREMRRTSAAAFDPKLSKNFRNSAEFDRRAQEDDKTASEPSSCDRPQQQHNEGGILATMPINGFIRLSYNEADVHLLEFVVCQAIKPGSNENDEEELVLTPEAPPSRHHCMAKQLHISDTFKGKAFSFHFNLVLPNITVTHNQTASSCEPTSPFVSLGVFQSDMVRVISKPSKKKATSSSTRNSDLCILSGSRVALFNRLRSQTSSTRFLYVDERPTTAVQPENASFHTNSMLNDSSRRRFTASLSQWGAFYIYLVSKTQSASVADGGPNDPQSEIIHSDGFIHYGQPIKLVCARTGLVLPQLIVFKIDKNLIDLDSVELVSQLHKCAFYVEGTSNMYLSITQDEITVSVAEAHSPYTPTKLRIREGCGWTIINVDEKHYNFVLPPPWLIASTNGQQPVPLLMSVTPIPIVTSIRAHAATGGIPSPAQQYLCVTFELIGSGFSLTNYYVFFGGIQMDTVVRCDEMMHCHFPSAAAVQNALVQAAASNAQRPQEGESACAFILPALLVRFDGVMYPTTFSVDLRQVISTTIPASVVAMHQNDLNGARQYVADMNSSLDHPVN